MAEKNLTNGPILKSLIRFAFPVLLALFLQAMYGAADLLIVGKFAGTYEQSGVATGSQLVFLVTMIITGLSMGVTVFLGHAIGAGKKEEAGRGVGTAICLFALIALIATAATTAGSRILTELMNAPAEAFAPTNAYIRICGIGSVFIVAYNVLGAIFRGIGDSKTPLITVAIACVLNIGGAHLSAIFSNEPVVIEAAHEYLKAYAIDCVLTAVLFCFIGYFNGCERTVFVMLQGIVGAFCVRVPVVYLISRLSGITLFHIGLGTPASTVVQIILCLIAYRRFETVQATERTAGARFQKTDK